MDRFAVVVGGADSVGQYLPDNYRVLAAPTEIRRRPFTLIGGRDVAGWTLDGYVLPRLASGLYWGVEVELPWGLGVRDDED